MGFPLGYPEFYIPFPTFFIHTLTFLSTLQNVLCTLLNHLCLCAPPPSSAPPPRPSATLTRRLLPVCRLQEERESCTVCLSELCKGEEIRWLPNCKHIFHRSCLDRWIDLDHATCPLCRTPFLSDHTLVEFDQRLVVTDVYI